MNLNLVKLVRGKESGEIQGFVAEPHRTLYDRADFEARLVKHSDCKPQNTSSLFEKVFLVVRDAMGVIFTIYGYSLRNHIGNVNFNEVCSQSGQYLKELLVLNLM